MKLALACANDPTADVEFYLLENQGTIQLKGRKKGGWDYLILGVLPNGILERYSCINNLGLQVDKIGKIKITDV